MNVLVLNCGSSSVKFQLIETSLERMKTGDEPVLAKGNISKIGSIAALVEYQPTGKPKVKETRQILDHQTAIGSIVNLLVDPQVGVIPGRDHIHAVGHRIVHGGENFSESVIIDENVAATIRDCNILAPLHNPHNLKGYQMAHTTLPNVPHVAVFDTAFHQSMKPYVYLYGLPYVLYQQHKIRRYGFHGTSHRYVYGRCQTLVGPEKAANLKAITTHLGNGCSMAAVHAGKSVDTTMGFTPLEGLLMGTRCGDLDPAVVLHLMGVEDIGVNEVNTLLNKHSGLQGVSGVSNDMREVVEAAKTNPQAEIALNMFCYRIKKYIGAYMASLNGTDAVIFTGGIGENSIEVRKRVCSEMEGLGIVLDENLNHEKNTKEALISAPNSRVQIWIIPTNEEIVIARDTARCVEAAKGKEK
ncbi:MAG: acetate kinase [Candidatus Sumerlaeota bacterium]|nr:acetate kinase [Candidatus Sumerlaeota bacterium]